MVEACYYLLEMVLNINVGQAWIIILLDKIEAIFIEILRRIE